MGLLSTPVGVFTNAYSLCEFIHSIVIFFTLICAYLLISNRYLAPTQRDFKWEYEGDEIFDETTSAQVTHDIAYQATNCNEWDIADELYDQSDDEWLIDCMGKDLINKEDEC